MSGDIVERLRRQQESCEWVRDNLRIAYDGLERDAADEIERLRERVCLAERVCAEHETNVGWGGCQCPAHEAWHRVAGLFHAGKVDP